MLKHQNLVVEVIEQLGLESVFSIEFTGYKVVIQTDFDELVQVDGVAQSERNGHLHLKIKVNGIEVVACKNKNIAS